MILRNMGKEPWLKPPTEETLFFRHNPFVPKLGTKIVEKLTWHCCMLYKPLKWEGGL
jgi:hypothetical protein